MQYFSPELFLLPILKSVNFVNTQYSPTKEVSEAYEIFKEKNKNHLYYKMPWENH
jgi:hypothetical protein